MRVEMCILKRDWWKGEEWVDLEMKERRKGKADGSKDSGRMRKRKCDARG
jgi:hypothetical protein